MLAFAFLAHLRGCNGLATVFFGTRFTSTSSRTRRGSIVSRGLAVVYTLLPDPADADRLPAVARRASARSGTTRRRASAAARGRSGGTSAARSCARPSWAALLLLFANAFSAYATAAALISQGSSAHHAPDRRPAPERDRARPGEHRQGAGAGDDRDHAGRDARCTRSSSGARRGGCDDASPPSAPAGRRSRPRRAADRGRRGSRRQLGARIAILVLVLGLPDPAAVRDARVLDSR